MCPTKLDAESYLPKGKSNSKAICTLLIKLNQVSSELGWLSAAWGDIETLQLYRTRVQMIYGLCHFNHLDSYYLCLMPFPNNMHITEVLFVIIKDNIYLDTHK